MGLLNYDYTVSNECLALLFYLYVNECYVVVDIDKENYQEYISMIKSLLDEIDNYYYTEDNYIDPDDELKQLENETLCCSELECLEDVSTIEVCQQNDTNIIDGTFYTLIVEQISENKMKITVELKQGGDLLQDTISRYFRIAKNDNLIPCDVNILTHGGYINKLYKKLTAEEYNLKSYIVNDIKDVYALFTLYLDKKITIDTLDIKLNNSVDFKCWINATNFIESHSKTLNKVVETSVNNDMNIVNDRTICRFIDKLTAEENEIIALRDYLNKNSVHKPTYANIGKMLTIKLSENNIKQKVSSIKDKLGVNDLASAVELLKENNRLIPYVPKE